MTMARDQVIGVPQFALQRIPGLGLEILAAAVRAYVCCHPRGPSVSERFRGGGFPDLAVR